MLDHLIGHAIDTSFKLSAPQIEYLSHENIVSNSNLWSGRGFI